MDTCFFKILNSSNLDKIFEALKDKALKLELRGWIRRIGDKECEILAQGPKKHILEYKDTIGATNENFKHFVYKEYKNTFFSFKELKSLENKTNKYKKGYKGYINYINRKFEIVGWIVNLSNVNKPVKIRIFIDEEDQGVTIADKFRKDLLEKGVSYGFNSFKYKCNKKYLDGKSHTVQIKLEDIEKDASNPTEIKGVTKKTFKFPFHLELDSPWKIDFENQAHIINISASNSYLERKYLYAKNEIMHGNIIAGINVAKEVIELEPSYIFRDFGFRERYHNEKLYFSTFRDRLLDRWGKWYGNEVCERGENCCKLLNLPFNDIKLCKKDINQNDILEKYNYKMCPCWPRFFASKIFTKRYLHEKNIQASKTLLFTDSIKDLRNFNYPDNYVIKPDNDSGSRSVFIMFGKLNLSDGFIWEKEEIIKKLEEYKLKKPKAKFIVEELLHQYGVSKTEPIIPLDIKLHAFGGKVRIIHVNDKNVRSEHTKHKQQSWYSRNWVASPIPIREKGDQSPYILPPSNLDKLLKIGDEISRDVQCYIRIDMYDTSNGPVVGEITNYSHSGLGYTEMGNLVFSQLWEIYEKN